MTNKSKSGKTSKFKIGDIVRVKPGTKDPDHGFEIGRWVGEIEEIDLTDDDKWLYCILWNKRTIKKMDRKLIQRCEKDNLDYMRMYLKENELELGQ